MADGSDLSFVIGLLLRGPVCIDCLALKVGVSRIQVEGILHELEQHVMLSAGRGTCEICGKRAVVFRVGPPES